MKKLLISAAIITGLIAPGIFAATQYTSFSQGSVRVKESTGSTLSGSIQNPILSCMRSALREFSKEKVTLTREYKSKIRGLSDNRIVKGTVSGERNIKLEKMKVLQNDYQMDLLLLKEKYIQKQRTCTSE